MLLLLCRRRATRSGGGGAAEHDAINGISLRADRSSALALGPREKVRASQHKPARAASRPTSLCCVQIDLRDRNDGGAGGICGRGRRPFRLLVERGSGVGGQRRRALVRPAECDRQAAQAVSPLRGTLSYTALCAWRVCRFPTAACSSCSTAAPSAEPCTSRAALFAFADVVPVCECLVIPTSGGASCRVCTM